TQLYNIPSNKVSIVPNGIDLSRFPLDAWNNESAKRFIFSSSPDRGLDVLLNLWPTIREHIPDAQLDIFYGWGLIEKIIEQYRQAGRAHLWLENFRAQCLGMIETLG